MTVGSFVVPGTVTLETVVDGPLLATCVVAVARSVVAVVPGGDEGRVVTSPDRDFAAPEHPAARPVRTRAASRRRGTVTPASLPRT